MSFRSGRRLARHTYPEFPRGGGSSSGPFARNYAEGPSTDTTIDVDPGIQLPWPNVAVGSPGVNIPITPLSTGVVRISGTIVTRNDTTDPETQSGLQVLVQVDGASQTFPFFEAPSTEIASGQAIPFLAEVSGLAIGVQSNISILLIAQDANGAVLQELSSSIEVIEVAASTG